MGIEQFTATRNENNNNAARLREHQEGQRGSVFFYFSLFLLPSYCVVLYFYAVYSLSYYKKRAGNGSLNWFAM